MSVSHEIINRRGQYKCPIIYGLCDPDTMEIRYIGKSIRGSDRPFDHLKPSSFKEGNTPKINWIKKLQRQGKNPVIVLLAQFDTNLSNDDLYEYEQLFIAYYKSEGCNLTNLSDGGPGMTGFRYSEETRKKMSESAKKRPLPKALLDKQKPKEFKKPRKPHPSRVIPGARLNDAKKRGKIVIALNVVTNQVNEFWALREAARQIGGKCSKSGIRWAIQNNKEYYGFKWSYK